ncbi:MAG: hypothetical protein PF495_21420 [Spirochaetales bacterium]|jgi:hypothetical protein|nr:hypothetical protein [Spirochaetales bacterium]
MSKIRSRPMRMLCVAAVLILLSFSSFVSAADSAVLHLRGIADGVFSVSVYPNPDIGFFNLTVKQDGLKVGEVAEFSNVRGGYTVTLTSANASAFNTDVPFLLGKNMDSRMFLEYEIYYGGKKVKFDSSGRAVLTDINNKNQIKASTNEVVISYDGSGDAGANLDTGQYSDVLTFSITPK